jgi:hypothetical protein
MCYKKFQGILNGESYSAPRKLDDLWVASTTSADFLIDSEGRLTMIKEMLIQQISLQQLIHICVFTLKFLDTNKKQR